MIEESKSGVYQIRNIINNKRYIGSAFDIKGRWRIHKRHLRKGMHCNDYLQRAWNKYGEDSFLFEILERVSNGILSKREFRDPLLAREQHYKDLYKSYDRKYGYDICKTAGSALGVIRTEEYKKKLSETKKRLNVRPMLGKKHSEESKRKMSIAHLGIIASNETRKKLSTLRSGKNNPMHGHEYSLSTRQKMSLAKLGKKLTAEHIENMSKSAKKRIRAPLSEETKNKIKKTLTGKRASDETREKMSRSAKTAWSNR